MMSLDTNYLYEYSLEDLFDFGTKFSLQENDIGFLEGVPEFDLESPNDNLMIPAKVEFEPAVIADYNCDSDSCKKASDTQETNGTEIMSQDRVEEMLHADKRETCSVFSFDSIEESLINLPVPAAYSSYQKILLKMIDEESVTFLLKNPSQIDQDLAEFLSCNVEVMTKVSCSGLQKGESAFEYVQRVNEYLQKTTCKRKDQKLRMIFNKIVKLLVKKSGKKESHRESKSVKMDSFYSKYAQSNKTEFEDSIKNCKFPSKKKLRSIFSQYRRFGEDFKAVLTNGIFVNDYIHKRELKAARLVNCFSESQVRFGPNHHSKTVSVLKECIKSFPWSMTDLTTSCALLESTL
jgi:hypothetical protein